MFRSVENKWRRVVALPLCVHLQTSTNIIVATRINLKKIAGNKRRNLIDCSEGTIVFENTKPLEDFDIQTRDSE